MGSIWLAAVIPHQRECSRWKTSRDMADVRTWVRRSEVPLRRHCALEPWASQQAGPTTVGARMLCSGSGTWMNMCMYVSVYLSVYTFKSVYVWNVRICMCTHMSMCVYECNVCICICMYMCVHMCMHMYVGRARGRRLGAGE